MKIIEAIKNRQSIRSFKCDPIPSKLVNSILEAASCAPSGVNTQPWHVHIVKGTAKDKISKKILEARKNNIPPNPDYNYYPKEWFEPYTTRRQVCGQTLYGALNIQRNDMEKRLIQWDKNYSFFSAPIGILFFIDSRLEKGSWLDMGMFIQNVMLAALEFGLGTCAQASMAEYPDIIRNELNIDKNFNLICGMALGYPEFADAVNNYRTTRETLDTFTIWHD